jgi:tRNA dimethylallyltransferase
MISEGAINEVEKLINMGLPQKAPILKAIGVKEITMFLRQEISFDQMLNDIQTNTRHYAKRQITWFNNQMKPNNTISRCYKEIAYN